MSCPTCDHTMEAIQIDYDDVNGRRSRWVAACPRCGTIKVIRYHTITGEHLHEEVHVPKLVERCREFEGRVLPSLNGAQGPQLYQQIRDEWKRIGLAESVNPPARRPLWA